MFPQYVSGLLPASSSFFGISVPSSCCRFSSLPLSFFFSQFVSIVFPQFLPAEVVLDLSRDVFLIYINCFLSFSLCLYLCLNIFLIMSFFLRCILAFLLARLHSLFASLYSLSNTFCYPELLFYFLFTFSFYHVFPLQILV